MIADPNCGPASGGSDLNTSRRIFLREPGWNVGLKVGNEREFCYMTTPGQDYYHRLFDGEVFLYHGAERLCLECAERRGLLAYEPKLLRKPIPLDNLECATRSSDFDI